MQWLLDSCKSFDFAHGNTKRKDSSIRASILKAVNNANKNSLAVFTLQN